MNEGVEERERERQEEFQTSAALRWRAPSPAPGQPFTPYRPQCMYGNSMLELFNIVFSMKEPEK